MISFDGKVLVVVDMEPGYRSAMDKEQYRAVRELIRAARQADSFIVFLEFLDEGTFANLLKLVRGYDMFVQEAKGQCDGSDEVIAACRRGGYDMNNFVVCGVETHVCVQETAQELARQLPNATVEVVMEACGSREGNDFTRFPEEENLTLVSLYDAN